MATFTNPETGKLFKIAVEKYDRMTSAELITEYDAINEIKYRRDYYRNRERINYIVDLIAARAEAVYDGNATDPVAVAWMEN